MSRIVETDTMLMSTQFVNHATKLVEPVLVD